MNKEKHFLEAINAGEPNADLIYADWLEEQGRSEADEIRNDPVFVFPEWVRSLAWSGLVSFSSYCYQSWSLSDICFESESWSSIGPVTKSSSVSSSGSLCGSWCKSHSQFDTNRTRT